MRLLRFEGCDRFSDEIIAVARDDASTLTCCEPELRRVLHAKSAGLVSGHYIQPAASPRDLGDPGRDVLVQVELHASAAGFVNGYTVQSRSGSHSASAFSQASTSSGYASAYASADRSCWSESQWNASRRRSMSLSTSCRVRTISPTATPVPATRATRPRRLSPKKI